MQQNLPKPKNAAQAANYVTAMRMQRQPIEAALREVGAIQQQIAERFERLRLALRLNEAEIGAMEAIHAELVEEERPAQQIMESAEEAENDDVSS